MHTFRCTEMKSGSKCDVEISITFDGTETIEPVPACLQDVFLSSSPTEPGTSLENRVTLPQRYVQTSGSRRDEDKSGFRQENEMSQLQDRERDIGIALEWIKQEMVRILDTCFRSWYL